MSAFVKVFGCRPLRTVLRVPGPAYEKLQGRKPREWVRLAGRRALWGFERGG